MRSGRQIAGRTVTVRWIANDIGLPRLGMNIGKRVMPRAVDRNRIKRRLREGFRSGCGSLQGVDVVVSLRAGSNRNEMIGREFSALLGKIAGRRP